MNLYPSALSSESPAISYPQQCSYPRVLPCSDVCFLVAAVASPHPSTPHVPATGYPVSFHGSPELLPLACIFLAVPSMNVALAAWELRALGSSEAFPLSLAETGPDCH